LLINLFEHVDPMVSYESDIADVFPLLLAFAVIHGAPVVNLGHLGFVHGNTHAEDLDGRLLRAHFARLPQGLLELGHLVHRFGLISSGDIVQLIGLL
jgi:hypothetical protein